MKPSALSREKTVHQAKEEDVGLFTATTQGVAKTFDALKSFVTGGSSPEEIKPTDGVSRAQVLTSKNMEISRTDTLTKTRQEEYRVIELLLRAMGLNNLQVSEVILYLEGYIANSNIPMLPLSQKKSHWVSTSALSQRVVVDIDRYYLATRIQRRIRGVMIRKEFDDIVAPYVPPYSLHKRRQIFLDLLDDEGKYVGRLEKLVNLTKNLHEKAILTASEILSVFSNIEILWETHKKIFSQLNDLMKGPMPDITGIGAAWLAIAPLLNCYADYLANTTHATNTNSRLFSSNHKYKSFVTKENGQKISMEGFVDSLMVPCVRIGQYCDVLLNLSKATPPSHIDSPQLSMALGMMDDVHSFSKDHLAKASNRSTLLDLQRQLSDDDKLLPDLTSNDRLYVDKLQISIFKKTRFHQRGLIVLSDMLIILKNDFVHYKDNVVAKVFTFTPTTLVFDKEKPTAAASAPRKKNTFPVYIQNGETSHLLIYASDVKAQVSLVTLIQDQVNNLKIASSVVFGAPITEMLSRTMPEVDINFVSRTVGTLKVISDALVFPKSKLAPLESDIIEDSGLDDQGAVVVKETLTVVAGGEGQISSDSSISDHIPLSDSAKARGEEHPLQRSRSVPLLHFQPDEERSGGTTHDAKPGRIKDKESHRSSTRRKKTNDADDKDSLSSGSPSNSRVKGLKKSSSGRKRSEGQDSAERLRRQSSLKSSDSEKVKVTRQILADVGLDDDATASLANMKRVLSDPSLKGIAKGKEEQQVSRPEGTKSPRLKPSTLPLPNTKDVEPTNGPKSARPGSDHNPSGKSPRTKPQTLPKSAPETDHKKEPEPLPAISKLKIPTLVTDGGGAENHNHDGTHGSAREKSPRSPRSPRSPTRSQSPRRSHTESAVKHTPGATPTTSPTRNGTVDDPGEQKLSPRGRPLLQKSVTEIHPPREKTASPPTSARGKSGSDDLSKVSSKPSSDKISLQPKASSQPSLSPKGANSMTDRLADLQKSNSAQSHDQVKRRSPRGAGGDSISQTQTSNLGSSAPALSITKAAESGAATGDLASQVSLKSLKKQAFETDKLIPPFMKYLVNAIEASLDVKGIYRVSALEKDIHDLRAIMDEAQGLGGKTVVNTFAPHAVADVFKLYFRELPTPLLTYEVYDDVIKELGNYDEDEAEYAKKLALSFKKMPLANFAIARYLANHLSKVAARSDENLMTVENLAIVFGPSLLYPKERSMADALALPRTYSVVVCMVNHMATVFQESAARRRHPWEEKKQKKLRHSISLKEFTGPQVKEKTKLVERSRYQRVKIGSTYTSNHADLKDVFGGDDQAEWDKKRTRDHRTSVNNARFPK